MVLITNARRTAEAVVYVAGGIHSGESFPPDFGRQMAFDWQPVAVVDSLV